jgi:REP element-mobilizing transposase RayT
MARKTRAEVEGGLYHVITRGNNRQQIFRAPADYEKFLSLLEVQKTKLPFFLYAYCLMTNHVHLLIERQAATIGRIMHRLLTGYSQYYNRRYHRVGHLLQGRHKSILCQSDRYLAELVRYIHLNPVRAGMVQRPEQYQHSGHRAYLGLDAAGIVDVNAVLRHFGAKKAVAREAYRQFVDAGIGHGHQAEFYLAESGQILGTDEFVDATIHRIGEPASAFRNQTAGSREFNALALMQAVSEICEVRSAEFCGSGKGARAVMAKEMLAFIGCQEGASLKRLSEVTGMNSSTVSRRCDAARLKVGENRALRKLAESIRTRYLELQRESQESQA